MGLRRKLSSAEHSLMNCLPLTQLDSTLNTLQFLSTLKNILSLLMLLSKLFFFPTWLSMRQVNPVVATEQPIVSTISFIKETPLYPVCRIGDSIVKSFDNTTYSYELDDCYHILAADSSSQYLFSVLGKETEGKKEVKVFVHETEVVMKPSPRYTVERKEYTIEVDGQPIEIRP